MQFHAQQNDYNQFAAAAASATSAYNPNIYYEQQQAMMPPHDALLYDLHDTYVQPIPTSDQMIIPPPSSTTTTTTMIPRAGVSATNTSSSNNRKRPKRKQVKNACGKLYQLFTPHTTPFFFLWFPFSCLWPPRFASVHSALDLLWITAPLIFIV